MNPYHHLKQPRIRRSVSCDVPLGDGFAPAATSNDPTSSTAPFQRTSPVRRTSSPTHKNLGSRSSPLARSSASSSTSPQRILPSAGSPPQLLGHPPTSPTKRHSHTSLSRPTTIASEPWAMSSSSNHATVAARGAAAAAPRRSSPGGKSAATVVSRWTHKRRRQRQFLMAKHFVTWFVATLIVGHLCAQLQRHQQKQRPLSARKGSLPSMFASQKRKRSSSTLASLPVGPCAINGTMYPTPILPTLLIVGAQKSGTTAMASILTNHELIQGPHPKSIGGQPHPAVIEGHFFDYHYRSLVDKSQNMVDKDEQTCWLRRKYAAQYHKSLVGGGGGGGTRTTEQHANPTNHRALREEGASMVYLEKSPSYLLSPHVPEAVHRLVPEAHILVLLRNPVHRLLSQYRMMMTTQQRQQQFAANLEKDKASELAPERRNNTERILSVEGASSSHGNGNLRGRNQRNGNNHQRFNDLESILNEELRLLQNPVRTYLTSVKGSGTKSLTELQFQFAIPTAPPVGSANYDAYYHWDDLARTPSNFRGFDRLLQRGMYSVQLERWVHAFRDLAEGNGDEKQKDGPKPEGAAKEAGRRRLPRPKNLIVIPYELFESHPLPVLDYLWRRLKVPSWTPLPSVLRARYSTPGHANNSNSASRHGGASPELLTFLYEFYRPYNDRLADMLGEEWRGIWEHRPAGGAGDAANDDDEVLQEKDDDDAIDSDPEAWKQAWLHKVLLE